MKEVSGEETYIIIGKKDNVKTISLKMSWNTASTKTRWSQGHSMVNEKEDEETMALSVS